MNTTILLLVFFFTSIEARLQNYTHHLGPFNQSDYATLAVLNPATISNGALQVTPDSIGDFNLRNRSGRIFLNRSFTLWTKPDTSAAARVASFKTSFLINVFRINGSDHGEGLAFIIAPGLQIPAASDGQYLGLTNAATDADPANRVVAVELDTRKQDFDPDDNHLGLNINSVKSLKTVPLTGLGLEIAPNGIRFHMVWIEYDGGSRVLRVYLAVQPRESDKASFVILPRPDTPVMTAENLSLSELVAEQSYFGFSASTGGSVQLNCVLRWNLTVELLAPPTSAGGDGLKIGLGVGAAALVVLVGSGVAAWYAWRRRAADPGIEGALKSLPGMPREFKFGELKKATNNFDDKHNKLGQGGFGVVYRGLLPKENMEIAVKKFSRDNIKGQHDFLSELTIINRLRHKHLVRLLGWCHKNETLLLVYDYMPNGSLDSHLFCGPEKAALSWEHRYKIVSGVASALHYLHNEYDQKVVHRDLKASNIMLDADFNARLGDFGLARAIENERTSYADLEAAGVPGTLGYIAPECFHTGRATRESDVYGFGAVVLELVCGERPSARRDKFHLLVDWVWWLHREGTILEAVDGRLAAPGEYSPEQARRLLLLGLACSHPDPGQRPKTQAIVQIISGSVDPPPVPPFKPAFVWPAAMPEGLDNKTSESNLYSMATSVTTGSSWQLGISEP